LFTTNSFHSDGDVLLELSCGDFSDVKETPFIGVLFVFVRVLAGRNEADN
jgi:hypothetical protein